MIARALAARIAASASRAGGMWITEDGAPCEAYVSRVEEGGARKLAVARDHGPIRTVHLMASDPVVLSGEKGPLDPRALGARVARFAEAHPTLVTILDVVSRLSNLGRHHFTGDWAGVQTNVYFTEGDVRVTQRDDGVTITLVSRETHVRALGEVDRACAEALSYGILSRHGRVTRVARVR